MPIKDMPRSFRRLGKIRLGEQLPVMDGGKQKVGKTGAPVFRPAKLERFRLTSPDRELLDGAAEVYGGEVREWVGAPGDGDHWELYITSTYLDVVIPPQYPSDEGDIESSSFQQWYELWSGGGCQRRCDGITEQISGKPCSAQRPACPADHETRREAAVNGNACKMTTRIMVLLPKLPDLGVWMLETHSWYAGVELGGFIEFLARRAPGQFVKARAFPDPRSVKRKGKTHNFMVPAFKLSHETAGELLAGAAAPQALGTGEPSGTGLITDAERVRTFVIRCSDNGWDDDIRHAIVGYATKGRTRSSREVAVDEWPAVEAVVRWFADGKLVLDESGSDPVGPVLRKPASAPAPAANGPIPAQSREMSPDEPPDEDAADDFDRSSLLHKLEGFDEEHTAIAMARWTEAGIPPPHADRLTKSESEAAWSLLTAVEQEAKATYADRLKTAVTSMAKVGIKKTDAQATLLMEATEGRGGSLQRMSAVDLANVVDYCQALLDADAEAEKAAQAS